MHTRRPALKLKHARKHRPSSQRWLLRQLNDPFVHESKRLGYRSRAAFKLGEIDDKYKILKPGVRVLDLGCAPGGWLQIVQERVGASQGSFVVGVDLLPVIPIPGVTLIEGNFLDPVVVSQVLEALGGGVDVVMSDMAASSTGHAATDHLKIMALLEAALECAEDLLTSGGAFVAKVLQGGTEQSLLARLKSRFTKVAHFKPKSSRKDSAESYVVALGFKPSVESNHAS